MRKDSSISDSVTCVELRESISEQITDAMKEQGLNKADLARILGTSRSNITQILKGDRNFTVNTLCEVADAIGYKVCVRFKKARKPRKPL